MEIKDQSIGYMLDFCAKYNLKDNEGNTPIHLLVKNYYAKSLKKLKDYDIKDYGSNVSKKTIKLPLHYMINEYKNHLVKYNNNEKKITDINTFFTSNQYTEIQNMIYSNEDFGNNIIRNLELSYSMIMFILHRFLTFKTIIFDKDFEPSDFRNLTDSFKKLQKFNLNSFNKNDFTNFLKNNITDPEIFLSDKDLVANNIQKSSNLNGLISKKIIKI